jgi:hypothetical protein
MIRKPLVLSLTVLAACALVFCAQAGGLPGIAYLYISSGPGEQMAYDLVPQYPGSRLISSQNFLHPNSGDERREYRTPDDIDSVLAFMRQHFPDQAINAREGIYALNVMDRSWLSNLAMPIAHDNAYPDFIDLPQAYIHIYKSSESSNDTVIAIQFYWPLW